MCTPTLYSTRIIVITWGPSWEWDAAPMMSSLGWWWEFWWFESLQKAGQECSFGLAGWQETYSLLLLKNSEILSFSWLSRGIALWDWADVLRREFFCPSQCFVVAIVWATVLLCSSGWLGTHDLATCSPEARNWKHVPFLVASLTAIQSPSAVWTWHPSSSNINKRCLEQGPTTHPGKRIKTGWSLF